MGASASRLCTVVRLASFMAMPHQFRPLQHRQMFGDSRLRYAGTPVKACTVCSPSRANRSKIARRVGSARALKT